MQALHALYGNIFHEGTRYEATVHAVPFLARLAADGQTPHRDQIVHLLAALAIGYDETFLPAGYTSLGGEPRSIGCAWRILTSRDATLKPGLTRPGVRPNGGSSFHLAVHDPGHALRSAVNDLVPMTPCGRRSRYCASAPAAG